jgi:methionyl-tRNA formyltransferase
MSETYPRIVFVGGHFEAERPLKHLLGASENVVGLFTLSPERRARISGGIDLSEIARAAGIPCTQQPTINSTEALSWVRDLQSDVLLVVGWTELVNATLLSIPKFGCLGFHASLLPKYRGRAPVNWAILNGETTTGNTMIVLEPGADEGDIVSQRCIPIDDDDDCRTLYEKVSVTECDMLDEVLPLIRENRLQRRKQDSALATVMPKRRPQDGEIDWGWSAKRIHDWIRALTSPYPGAFSYFGGRKVIVWKSALDRSTPLSSHSQAAIFVDSEGYPCVARADGRLRLIELQPEGEGPVTGIEAARTFLKQPAFFLAHP